MENNRENIESGNIVKQAEIPVANVDLTQNEPVDSGTKLVPNSPETVTEEIRGMPDNPEQEAPFEPVENLAEFMEALEQKIYSAEDEKEKIALVYALKRLKSALAGIKAKPEKFKIRAAEKGNWTAYSREREELSVSEDFLEAIEDSRLSAVEANVAFREAEFGEKGVMDTGFRQILIQKSGKATSEYHKDERGPVMRWFAGLKKEKLLELAVDPEKLADYFLERETAKRISAGRLPKADELADFLKEKFRGFAPKAYKKLKQNGYGFQAKIKELAIKSQSQ